MTPARTRLTTALRELRARTGLSLAGLAERTAYSKSSWERYLNGRTMPPRQAVQDLCRLAREPDGRLLALWEIAESEWSGRAGEAATPAPAPPGPRPRPRPREATRPTGAGRSTGSRRPTRRPTRGRGRLVAVLVSVCAVTVGGLTSALLLLPHREGEPRSSSSPPVAGPRCRGTGCEGQDPMHMVCGAGPETLTTHRTTSGARLEVRYSERCGASWARMWGTRVGDRLEMTAGGPTRRAEIQDDVDAESYVYTVMTATRPGDVVRACFRPAASDGGERECVDARVRPSGTSRPPSSQ
ncbi:helix-turn-helix domain-containing protein [Streptomyces sp. NPDC096048]|uniref:helix-turn-helix domain-containing protein n=1 Tax=Streptomyces sp. NPDC096048 TaxID=3366072 RepID=UPI00382534AA